MELHSRRRCAASPAPPTPRTPHDAAMSSVSIVRHEVDNGALIRARRRAACALVPICTVTAAQYSCNESQNCWMPRRRTPAGRSRVVAAPIPGGRNQGQRVAHCAEMLPPTRTQPSPAARSTRVASSPRRFRRCSDADECGAANQSAQANRPPVMGEKRVGKEGPSLRRRVRHRVHGHHLDHAAAAARPARNPNTSAGPRVPPAPP